MPHRDGKKFRGTHTTYTDLAAKVADIAVRVFGVKGVSPGVLHNGAGSSCGTQKVKFTDHEGFILLAVRQSGSTQELRVFCKDMQMTRTALARALRDHDIPIAFRH
jgi:hypothetical protein